jgi:glycosyltransferase involved in cell wall biosynthesis
MSANVAIILPTFNRADYVLDAVASAIGQTYRAWEMVIVDDGSTDNTREVLASLSDPRIRVIHLKQNAGVSAARNAGIKATTAPIIATLDSDDFWFPNHLQECVDFLDENPDIDLVGTHALITDDDGCSTRNCPLPTNAGDVYSYSLLRCAHLHCTVVMRRAAIEAVGGYNERLRKYDDLDLWLRLRAANKRAANLPTSTAVVRESPQSIMRGAGMQVAIHGDIQMIGRGINAELGENPDSEIGLRIAHLANHNPLPGNNGVCRPALQALKRKYPDCRLIYEVEASIKAAWLRNTTAWRLGRFLWRAAVPASTRARVPGMV